MFRSIRTLASHRSLISSLCLLAVALISLRDVLVIPGVIGHTWDWDIPALAPQILHQISRFVFIWDYQFRGGFYSPYRPEGLYWFMTLPLAFFGGEVLTKTLVVLLLFLAGTTMRVMTAKVFQLDGFWSVVAGVLYMLSPAAYSRLVAGHMHMLTPYALLPLLFLLCWQMLHPTGSDRRGPLRAAVGAGVVLGLEGIHPSFFVIGLCVVGLTVLVGVFERGLDRRRVIGLVALCGMFLLVSAFWALPVGIGYLTTGTLYHSGWPTQQPDLVTASSVMTQRVSVFRDAMQPVYESLRQNSGTGIHVEYAFPVPEPLAGAWLFVSFALPIAAFGAFLNRKPSDGAVLPLALSGLLGIVLVSGSLTLPGSVLSQWLMAHAFPVWAEFSNTVRALPLICLAYAALAPTFLQRVSKSSCGTSRGLVRAISLAAVIIYTSPFLSGAKLIDPNEPLALRVYEPAKEDQVIYDYLQSDPDEARVTYVAPPWFFNPEYYDLAYEWIGGLSPKPEFFRPYFGPDAWRQASGFRSALPVSTAARMLGLGSVEYVIYPRDKYVAPFTRLVPRIPDDYSFAARAVDRVLESQTNLTRVALPVTNTQLFRNEAFLPRIYAADAPVLVTGASDSLLTLAASSLFKGQPAIFFDAQQPAGALDRLTSRIEQKVRVQSEDEPGLGTLQPATVYVVTSFPSSKATAAFSTAEPMTGMVRVRTVPFVEMLPAPSDVSAATLEPVQADDIAEWTGNVLFQCRSDIEAGGLVVGALLDGSSPEPETVVLDVSIEPIDLTQHPDIHIVSQVENPRIQGIQLELGLDLDGDDGADESFTTARLAHTKSRLDVVNVLSEIKRVFPDKPYYRVVRLAVGFVKSAETEFVRFTFPHAFYRYGLRELSFGAPDGSTTSIELPANPPWRQTVSLSRTLREYDLLRYPLLLDYQVDGPATLDANLQLTIRDDEGSTETLDLGRHLLKPFSEATIELDARELVPRAGHWVATRLDLAGERLIDKPELRPTTLAITAVGVRRTPQPGERPLVPPQLTLDDKDVALHADVADAEGVDYVTGPLQLPAGDHSVSGFFDNSVSDYAVESIEIHPAQEPISSAVPGVTFEKINPTRYVAHIKDAHAPFFLVFSESFHADWRAFVGRELAKAPSTVQGVRWYEPSALASWFLDGGGRVIVPEHYRVNGYANSWYIDQTGSFDVVIEFVPQRLYEAGLVTSIVTLAGYALYLLWTSLAVKRGGAN